MQKGDELHITCDCHTHELHIDHDPIGDIDNWCVSFWMRGYCSTTGWIWRLRCIWHIIKTGRPYGDEVILSRSQMKELFDYINKQLNT